MTNLVSDLTAAIGRAEHDHSAQLLRLLVLEIVSDKNSAQRVGDKMDFGAAFQFWVLQGFPNGQFAQFFNVSRSGWVGLVDDDESFFAQFTRQLIHAARGSE